MCTNHKLYEKECISYIERLHVPDGFDIDILTVEGAESMASGYNQAMKESDARYKIYLHQDVFIIYKDFLTEILRLFRHKEIGLVGIVGSSNIEESAVMWYGARVGMLYSHNVCCTSDTLFGKIEGEYQEVSAVDGLLMATQYDISWREDIFKKWDFYDISQSFEFRKKGYQVVVPAASKPWCIHDDGILDLGSYFKEREIFLKEYIDR